MKKVFIGNLPADALLIDIKSFLGQLKLSADFQTLQGRDCHRNNYHYVVATLNSEVDIDNLIEKYGDLSFQGNRLIVREFMDRAPCPEDWHNEERRINA